MCEGGLGSREKGRSYRLRVLLPRTILVRREGSRGLGISSEIGRRREVRRYSGLVVLERKGVLVGMRLELARVVAPEVLLELCTRPCMLSRQS